MQRRGVGGVTAGSGALKEPVKAIKERLPTIRHGLASGKDIPFSRAHELITLEPPYQVGIISKWVVVVSKFPRWVDLETLREKVTSNRRVKWLRLG